MIPENGFALLRERVARVEVTNDEHGRRIELLELHERAKEESGLTSRRFVLTTSLASSGMVFTAVGVIAALLR